MTRTVRLLAGAAALAAAGTAVAQETGVYVGASLGQASYREACKDFDRVSGTPGAFNCMNKEDSAGKVFAGWRFHRNFAAELSYFDYGEARETASIGGAPVEATSRAKAVGLAALLILPLAGEFSAFAKAGWMEVRSRTTVGGTVAEDKQNEALAGIGALYQFSRGWGLRAEYERVNDTKIDLFSLGVQYLF